MDDEKTAAIQAVLDRNHPPSRSGVIMSRSTVHTLAQLRSLPVGTTMSLGDLVPVVKVEAEMYATPSDIGSGWSYYSEPELTGEIQGDPAAAWLGRLTISEIPVRP